MKYSNEVEKVVSEAKKLAKTYKNRTIEIPHIWQYILENNKRARDIYIYMGASMITLREINKEEIEKLPAVVDESREYGEQMSHTLYHLFSDAKEIAKTWNDNEVYIDTLVVALMNRYLNPMVIYLDKLDVDKENLERIVNEFRVGKSTSANSPLEQENSALANYTTNLSMLAESESLSTVISRDSEIRDLIRILSRKTKNNPVLVGEPGVGKTAVVEGLANRIAIGDVPETFKDFKIYLLNMGTLLAGASYRGEFEARLEGLLKELEEDPNALLFIDEIHSLVGAGKAEGSMDAGNILKPKLARGQLKVIGATTNYEYRKYFEKDKALERRFQQIRVEETNQQQSVSILRGLKEEYESFHNVEILDSALVKAVELSERYINERYLPDKAIDILDEACASVSMSSQYVPEEIDKLNRKIERNEMELTSLKEGISDSDSEQISTLEQEIDVLKNRLNDHQAILDEELEQLKELDEKEESLIKLLDQGASESEISQIRNEIQRLRNNIEDFDYSSSVINNLSIMKVVQRITGIPVNKMQESEKAKLLNLQEKLNESVIGQEQAVQAVSDAIVRSFAGIGDPNQPMGSFLFLGPTGVGKTELTKTLAYELFGSEDRLIRFDMSEFMEKHSVSQLIGSPPGYVGHDEGGQLTEAVRLNPYSIILFDEIEKAHKDVFNTFLQLFDDGRLTDSKGRTVNFKNTIIIMTSNIGSEILLREADEKTGQVSQATIEKTLDKLNNFFRPEFLNRIDEKIIFNTLSQSVVKRIVQLMIQGITERIISQGYKFSIDDSALDLIAKESFEPVYGARPIGRYITQEIANPISKMIVSDQVKDGDRILITQSDNKLRIETEK